MTGLTFHCELYLPKGTYTPLSRNPDWKWNGLFMEDLSDSAWGLFSASQWHKCHWLRWICLSTFDLSSHFFDNFTPWILVLFWGGSSFHDVNKNPDPPHRGNSTAVFGPDRSFTEDWGAFLGSRQWCWQETWHLEGKRWVFFGWVLLYL